MSRITLEQKRSIRCACSAIKMSRKDDFITRLSCKLKLHRKQLYKSYGAMVKDFIDEAGLTYLEAHQADGYELKRIYRELCKKEV